MEKQRQHRPHRNGDVAQQAGPHRPLQGLPGLDTVLRGGVPGANLLHLAGSIDPADAEAMVQAIDLSCEVVPEDDW